ncbi:MAG: hypothetical protein K8823_495 [Cenarchaeum symbiont of Oopsacas minuta]|nr:hypothetical protein [Cenarchaeum symbiont of Oopsacas minuta]
MSSQDASNKKYEEFVYVLGIKRRTRTTTIKNKYGDILYGLGQRFLNVLEILIEDDAIFEIGSKISINVKDRTKIESVLGRISYKNININATNEISSILESLVVDTEEKFVHFINTAGPITYRINALEMIPGIGKKLTKNVIEEREVEKFENFDDIEKRTGCSDIVKNIARRIQDELEENASMNLFVKK